MPVFVACPDCENHFKVKDELVGRKIRCPKCAAVLTVADEEESAAPRSNSGEEPRSRFKPRKKPAGRRGLLIGLVGGGVLLLFLGVGLVGLVLYLRQSGKGGADASTRGPDTTNRGVDTTNRVSDAGTRIPDAGIPALRGVADNPKVTEENFDRVKKEMSREQAEAILGPGEKIPRTEIYKILQQPTPARVTDKTTVVKWKNGGDTILLEWTADGGLVWSSYVRDQGPGKPPKSRGLGFPRLE
jgi:hypothetical protein